MIRMGYSDPKAARELWIMCSRDFFFYCNTFVWTYDPKNYIDEPTRPMITWDFQDNFLSDVIFTFGKEDVAIEKSRDMAATTGIMTVFEWRWKFRSRQQLIIVSRNSDYVDKPRDPKSLFWKLDFILEHCPKWLNPNLTRTSLNLQNEDNGSTIGGESTTGDICRGSKPTSVLIDEFQAVPQEDSFRALGATRDATRNRIFNFTASDPSTAAYQVSKMKIKQIRLHWSIHPDKNRGLYTSIGGKLEILDKAYAFPSDYEFILDNKLRSPWYDGECRRCASQAEIDKELDMNDTAASYPFYDQASLEYLEKNFVCPPYMVGNLIVNPEMNSPGKWLEDANGNFLLWMNLLSGRPLPNDEFAIGADTSAGTGASNSCLSIANIRTREKVGEYVTPFVPPSDFAIFAVGAARFFNNAKLIWETNGPGREFGDKVISLGYRRVYFRQNEQSLAKKMTDTPGWAPTVQNKIALHGHYRHSMGFLVNGKLEHQEFLVRSGRSIAEAKEYVRLPNGSVEHIKSATSMDPSGARANHGDMCTADALVWKECGKAGIDEEPGVARPEHCLATRHEEAKRFDKQENYW